MKTFINIKNFVDNSNIGTSSTFTTFVTKLVNITQQDLNSDRLTTSCYVWVDTDHYQNKVIKEERYAIKTASSTSEVFRYLGDK